MSQLLSIDAASSHPTPKFLSSHGRPPMLHAVLLLLVGVLLGSLVTLGAAFSASRCDVDIVAAALRENSEVAQENVDFHFQMLNISTPRQSDKLMNVFVKWRYPPSTAHCPFHPTDNTCIQYQHAPMDFIRNVTQVAQPGLPLGAEWERVALFMCRHLYSSYLIAAVSVLVQVNGDGRTWVEAYEPGAHGSTCTIGPPNFQPIELWNPQPDFVDGDEGPGRPKSR